MGKQGVPRENDDLPPEQIHCKKQACDIQYCLARQNLNQNACQEYIQAWEECRDKARARDAAKRKRQMTSQRE